MLKHTRKQLAWVAKHQVARLAKDEEGAALVEYGMLVGLIAAICIAAVTLLGTSIQALLSAVAAAIAAIPLPPAP